MSVQGRLKERIQFLREVLKAPNSVLGTIESGYVLPLKSEPTLKIQCNPQSAIVKVTGYNYAHALMNTIGVQQR